MGEDVLKLADQGHIVGNISRTQFDGSSLSNGDLYPVKTWFVIL
jgi:hypothetical protein